MNQASSHEETAAISVNGVERYIHDFCLQIKITSSLQIADVMLGCLLCLLLFISRGVFANSFDWDEDQKTLIQSLSLSKLQQPETASNQYARNQAAAELGKRLFFDMRLSANNQIACSLCHLPAYYFTDPRARSEGLYTTRRHAMTLIGASYADWYFWDGRADSLWSQALGPLESAEEHGTNRSYIAHQVHQYYRQDYESIFGRMPDLQDQNRYPLQAGPVRDEAARIRWQQMAPQARTDINRVFANVGKALAAYQRQQIAINPGKLDQYIDYLSNPAIDDEQTTQNPLRIEEEAGLALFIGKAKCIQCHDGALLTSFEFFNTGVPDDPDLPFDSGRLAATYKVLENEFNCLSEFSDAPANGCPHLEYMRAGDDEAIQAFKVPTLRHISHRPPYMHNGIFKNLDEVINHYNQAPHRLNALGHSQIERLNLTEEEKSQLKAFLQIL